MSNSGLRSVLVAWVVALLVPNTVNAEEQQTCASLLDYEFKVLGKDERVHLCEAYQGKLVLVVNTASKCAFTPQYDGLEALYDKYQDRGLVVLGFPSNDFAGQEPGTEKQISNFCRLTYGVKFPMFEKVHAAKASASPFYQALAARAGEFPQWNFHKYLIGPDGNLLASFKSHITPEDSRLRDMILSHLPSSGGSNE